MKKPTTPPAVEFTAAGQARNNSLGLEQGLALATGPHTQEAPYLGAPDVVQDLLGAFLSEELDRIVAVSEGTQAEAAAQELTAASIARYVRIFSGQDARYTFIPGWHTPSSGLPSPRLVDAIRQARELPATTTAEQALQTVFVAGILAARRAVGRFVATQDALQLGAALQEQAETDARLLVGLQGLR